MAAAEHQSREELLASFQGITAIDDVTEAIFHLDNANWDLMTAVNRVMPQDMPSVSYNHNSGSQSSDVDIEVIDEDISVIKPRSNAMSNNKNDHAARPSTSNMNNVKIIHFQIHYLNETFNIQLPDYTEYHVLQNRIADLTTVPVCRQNLNGLHRRLCSKPNSYSTLASLNLSDVCDIVLTVQNGESENDKIAARLMQTFLLNIDYISENGTKQYNLTFCGDKTVLDIKESVYSLTNVPVRDQIWEGWPTIGDLNNTLLAMIELPETHLVMRKRSKPTHNEYEMATEEINDDENSDEDYGDPNHDSDDDDIIITEPTMRNEPLIPDRVDDETVGSEHFIERFKTRYGSIYPLFFEGTLEGAIKEACMKPAKDRRLLGIYIHHEKSIFSNIYCTSRLGAESVLQILAANFIVYGWDFTFESNKTMFLNSLKRVLGALAGTTIESIPTEKYPILIIIMRIRSVTEIFSIIHGHVSIEEFSGQLIEGVERWTSKRDEEIQEEEERAARQRVKWEQDEAYRESLEADRAKEEQKKQVEMTIKGEQMRAENERLAADRRREEMKKLALSRLPPEPAPSEPDNIEIRIRVPDGKNLSRRFKFHEPLQALLDFLTVEGFPAGEYKIISYPRRDLSSVSSEQTFSSLKMHSKETVMLEKQSNE